MYEERVGDPILAMKLRFAGAAVGAAGLVFLVVLLSYLAPAMLLDASSASAPSIDLRQNRWFGTQYEITVEHRAHWCSGGDGGLERFGTRIAYDAGNPERCRVAAMVGRLGIYEIVAALGSSTFIAVGLGATVLWNNRKARVAAFAVAMLLGWSYMAVSFFIHRGSHG